MLTYMHVIQNLPTFLAYIQTSVSQMDTFFCQMSCTTFVLPVQGKVLYFESCEPPLVVTDPEWFIQTIQDIEQRSEEVAGKDVKCVSHSTRLWTDKALMKLGLENMEEEKVK